jgi:hypothetical protein
MALNFPSSPTNGQLYTDPNAVVWRFDGVKWNVERGTAYKTFSGAKINFTTTYNLTSTSQAVSFDNVLIDIDNYYEVANPTRITVSQTAFYRINFSAYTTPTGSAYTIMLKKNGTTTLSSVTISPNQYTNFDEVVDLVAGDYLEVYASEAQGTGGLTTSTFFEIARAGYAMGTAVSAATAFSGVRGILGAPYAVTSTASAIAWDTTSFNQNADASGATYWVSGTPSRFTIAISGFYRLKGFIAITNAGDYTLALKKNTSTILSSITISAFETTQLDELYEFAAGDYLELFVNDLNSTGALSSSTYLEMIRIGV